MSKSKKNPFIPSQPGAGERLHASLQALRYSPAFRLGLGYFAACFISIAAVTLLTSRLYTQQTEIMIDEYGNTVAQQLAQTSVDAVVRGDLVSLHAQLEKLTEMNTIVDAAVYDMDNHVLAQATSSSETKNAISDDSVRTFPAAITFQDSIAGKVIVSLNTQKILKQKHWLYSYFICGLIIALGIIVLISNIWVKHAQSLYAELVRNVNKTLISTTTLPTLEGETPRWQELGKMLNHLDEHIRYLTQLSAHPKPLQTGKYLYKPTEGSYAELMIACSNLDQLQQQVHHREVQRLLDNFQEQLDKVTKLYNGVNIHSPGDHILLRFLVNDVTDASLQAICCAVLLKGLLKVNTPESTTNILLEFRFAIRWHTHDDRPVVDLLHNHLLLAEQTEMLRLCQQAKAGDILTTKGIKQSPAVAEHIKLDLISGDSDVDYYRVLRISDSYKKLLEQQIQQLETIPQTQT